MKKTIFIIFWTFAFFIVGLAIFAIYVMAVNPVPSHADATSPEVQHWAMNAGLVSWIFPIGLPILVLILGICGKLPGTRRISN
jgi:hypothetical protein